MNATLRNGLFFAAAFVLGTGLLQAAGTLPRFGSRITPYAAAVNARAPGERQAQNVPTAITFDYRGFDTLGEEFIVFVAVAGVARVLKHGREQTRSSHQDAEREREVPRDPGAAIWAMGLALGAGILLLGANTVLHGNVTPGSGFQGGSILSAAWLLVYLAFGSRVFRSVTGEQPIEAAEALGAAAYTLIGISGLIAGGAFLFNFMPLGTFGHLASTGTIEAINLGVGCEVGAAFVMLFALFLDVARTEAAQPTRE